MARNRNIPKPWKQARTRALYPTGWPDNMRAVLYLNGLDNGSRTGGDPTPPPPDPFGPEIAPDIDFTQWWQTTWALADVTQNTFTNSGTAALIGYPKEAVETGATYRIIIESSRGAGSLRMYFTSEYNSVQQPGSVDVPNGRQEFDVVADGENFSFRISVGDTTTEVTYLSIRKVNTPTE